MYHFGATEDESRRLALAADASAARAAQHALAAERSAERVQDALERIADFERSADQDATIAAYAERAESALARVLHVESALLDMRDALYAANAAAQRSAEVAQRSADYARDWRADARTYALQARDATQSAPASPDLNPTTAVFLDFMESLAFGDAACFTAAYHLANKIASAPAAYVRAAALVTALATLLDDASDAERAEYADAIATYATPTQRFALRRTCAALDTVALG